MHPKLAVVQRMDDAQVPLIVHHDQVEEEGQEEEIGEDVYEQARRKVQRSNETHARDEGQSEARTEICHQQAQEEVIGRVMELSVAGDTDDDEQVGEDDDGGQRQGDEDDKLLLLTLVHAVHRGAQYVSPSLHVS